MYLLDRYGTLIFQTFVFAGTFNFAGLTLTDKYCRGISVAAGFLCYISIAFSNAIVLLQVTLLIGKNKLTAMLFAILVLTTGLSFGLTMGVQLRPALRFVRDGTNAELAGPICLASQTNVLGDIGIALGTIFDVFALATIGWISADSVREHGGQLWEGDSWCQKFWGALLDNSFFYFLLIFLLRLMNVFSGSFGPIQMFSGFNVLSWTMSTVLMGRFMLRKRVSYRRRPGMDQSIPASKHDTDDNDEEGESALPVKSMHEHSRDTEYEMHRIHRPTPSKTFTEESGTTNV